MESWEFILALLLIIGRGTLMTVCFGGSILHFFMTAVQKIWNLPPSSKANRRHLE